MDNTNVIEGESLRNDNNVTNNNTLLEYAIEDVQKHYHRKLKKTSSAPSSSGIHRLFKQTRVFQLRKTSTSSCNEGISSISEFDKRFDTLVRSKSFGEYGLLRKWCHSTSMSNLSINQSFKSSPKSLLPERRLSFISSSRDQESSISSLQCSDATSFELQFSVESESSLSFMVTPRGSFTRWDSFMEDQQSNTTEPDVIDEEAFSNYHFQRRNAICEESDFDKKIIYKVMNRYFTYKNISSHFENTSKHSKT